MKQIVILITLFITFSTTYLPAAQTILRIAGGTAHIPIIKDIAPKFMQKYPDTKVIISGGGSGVGIKQVSAGIIDIGNSGRDLTDSEIKNYHLIPYKIAIDGIAVIVNQSNPVTNLTLKQIQNIFSGKIKNWKEVGGINSTINIYSRSKESGTRKTFEKLALNKKKVTDNAIFVSSNGNMKVMINQDKNSIGYLSAGYLDNKVKAIKINKIYPSLKNIKSGKYKIQRYLYMVLSPKSSKYAKKFIDTVLSPYGENIIKKHHYLSIK